MFVKLQDENTETLPRLINKIIILTSILDILRTNYREVTMAVAKKAMKQDNFYQDAAKYWETVDPSVDGMLGGYGHISSVDVAGSIKFLKPFLTVRFR